MYLAECIEAARWKRRCGPSYVE